MDVISFLVGVLSSLIAAITYAVIGFFLRRYRVRISLYKPLLDTAHEFFHPLAQCIERVNYRTLKMVTEKEEILVRGALGDLLPVEEVQAAFKSLFWTGENQTNLSYLVYPKELNPAASRQLDHYRLHDNTVIIPLSLTFIHSKLAAGPDAVREAVDGLLRRYLGKQDLFDMRNALEEPRFFFGRRALIDDIFNALNQHEHAAIIGPRKAGKSSLLNLLCQKLNAFPVVMVDLQLYARDNPQWPEQLLARIIEQYDRWGRARYAKKWNPPANVESPMSGPVFRAALETRRELQRQLKNNQPLVVMLDEMERVFPKTGVKPGTTGTIGTEGQEGQAELGEKVAQAERFTRAAGILRALGQAGGERLLSLVTADRSPLFNRINDFKIPGVEMETNPFYRFFREYPLKPLEESENREMLTEIGHAMGLELEPAVIDSIYSDSGGYPALGRQLASAANSQRRDSRTISTEHYRQGLAWLYEEQGDIDRFFKENFWYPVTEAERRVLVLASPHQGVSLETPGPIPVLEGETNTGAEARPGVEILRPALVEARKDMLATGILEKYNDKYRVSGALFRTWLQEWGAPGGMMNDE
jgi:hypothetical protein